MDGNQENQFKRDPYKVKRLFQNLNTQQKDLLWDFKFLKDMRTPTFTLSLIERVLINDQILHRFESFRKIGSLMDGRDVITANLDHQSTIQYPLERHDNMMVDIYIQQVFQHNQHSDNKYSQLMRILPIIIDHSCLVSISNAYFQFFNDSDQFLIIDDAETSYK